MKLKVIVIGRLRSCAIGELVDDYGKRLIHYFPFEVVIAKDERSIKVERDDFLVICDEHGEETSSKGLADFINRHLHAGTRRLVFFIGDAHGISKDMKARAKTSLSLSKMTFPHELARVILLEQLYRACTILRREKYHYG